MATADPRVRRSRDAVLAAAVELFVAGDLSGVTVDAVVARSGVAKTTVYRHWPNRQALLLDVFRRFDHRLDPPASPNPVARLTGLLRQLAATLTTPEWQRALPSLLDAVRRVDEFAALHAAMPSPGVGLLSAAIRDLIAAGTLPPTTNPAEVLLQLTGPLTLGAILDPALVTDAFVDRLVASLIGPDTGE